MGGRRGGKRKNKTNHRGGGGVSSESPPPSSSPKPPRSTTNEGGEEGGGTKAVSSRGRRRIDTPYHPGAGVDRLMVVAGTYDGVLVGWDTTKGSPSNEKGLGDDDHEEEGGGVERGGQLRMTFAVSDAHEGSVRSLSISGTANSSLPLPGLLVSAGYDEFLRCYDLNLGREIGEGRTPPDLDTPLCTAFAPPGHSPTHCLVGLTSGKIVIYSIKDWSVVHVLSGHPGPNSGGGGARGRGGVTALACHPSGKLALSGGTDGTVRLWDLTRGRLAYVHRITTATPKDGGDGDDEGAATRPKRRGAGGGGRPAEVSCIVFSPEEDGSVFAFSHGKKVTARDTLSGETLLDVELPSRINDMCFLGQKTPLDDDEGGDDGGGSVGKGGGQRFIACACDDGSLPVLAVGVHDEDEGEGAIRAVMAIEPVDSSASGGGGAGDERFKCIESVGGGDGCLVVTANSGGILSVVDLSGAARMMTTAPATSSGSEGDAIEGGGAGDAEESFNGDDDDDEEDEEAAAEIIESVRVGSGARITDLAVWSCRCSEEDDEGDERGEGDATVDEDDVRPDGGDAGRHGDRTGGKGGKNVVELDSEAVARARRLVEQAKKKQRRHKEKREKKREKDEMGQRQQQPGRDGRSEKRKKTRNK